MTYEKLPVWIDTQEQLTALIATLRGAERIGIDTEFHGERTYIPRLMLLQLATEEDIYLVDPLAELDLCALFTAIAAPDGPLVIGHALRNDLEIVYLRCGTVLPRLFDTQIAGAFLGFGLQVGLSNLVAKVCDEGLPKDGQMADWSRRPLSEKLCTYAANDVRYLLQLHTKLGGDLIERGRDPWVIEECSRLSSADRYERDPTAAYKKVSKYRTLKPDALGVLAEVAAERELFAREFDMVVHFVVPDDILVTLARSTPSTRHELKAHRRLNHRNITRHADRWLAAIRRGIDTPMQLPKARPPSACNVDAASALVMLLVAELARQNELASQLLLKRTTVQSALMGGFDSREELLEELGLSGWRAELVGQPIWELLSGNLRAACEYDDGQIRVGFEGREGNFVEIRPREREASSGGRRRRRPRKSRPRRSSDDGANGGNGSDSADTGAAPATKSETSAPPVARDSQT